jgi:cytidine deaminase
VSALWQAAASAGLTRSVDVGSAAFLRGAGPAIVRWTAGADVIFANLAEGRLVSGLPAEAPAEAERDEPDGRDEVVSRLLEHYPVVVLKLGPEGAVAATRSEKVVCPPPTCAVVDPTGAGDAFFAGFLAHWLTRAPLAEAAQAATAAAASALGHVGGRPPVPPVPTSVTSATSAPGPAATAGTPASAGQPWPQLRQAARAAAATAYAPYSNLQVGAAGVTGDGLVVTGCNVENASFGLTLCAECGLVSALRAAGGERLVAVSVVAQDGEPLAPCGRCRQVLWDNGGPGLLIDRGPGTEPIPLRELLPVAFGAGELASRAAP